MIPDDLHRLRTCHDVRISPDGRQLAWTVGRADVTARRFRQTVRVASAADPAKAADVRDGFAPRWSPDGSRLAFLAAEELLPQVWLRESDGSVRRLTQLDGGAFHLAWSPDGTQLVVTERVLRHLPGPDEPREVTGLRARLDGVGWIDTAARLVVVDVATGDARGVTDGSYEDSQPAWCPDGEHVLFTSNRQGDAADAHFRADVHLVSTVTREVRRISSGAGAAAVPCASPDGRWVAWVGTDEEHFWDSDLHVWVTALDGTTPARRLAPDHDRPVWLPIPPVAQVLRWTDDSTALHTLVTDGGCVSVVRIGLDDTVRQISSGEVQVDSFDAGPDGSVVSTAHWPTAPSEVRDRSGRPLSRENDRDLVLPQVRRLQAGDVEAFVALPADWDGRTPLPTVIDVHGGPNAFHPQSVGTPAVLTGAGYAVVLPNPRGSQGYGADWTRGSTGDWGGKDTDDILACVAAAVAEGISDPDRLALHGYSYGGYQVLRLLARTSRFRAAVAAGVISDLATLLGDTDLPMWAHQQLGRLPWEDPAWFAERSPLYSLDKIRTPLLLVQWDGDLRTPVAQAQSVFTGLRLLDRDVRLLRFPGGGHGARTPGQARSYITQVLHHLNAHLSAQGA